MDFKKIFNKEKDLEQYFKKNIEKYKKQISRIVKTHNLNEEQYKQAQEIALQLLNTICEKNICKNVAIVATEVFYREYRIQVLNSMIELKKLDKEIK